MLHEASCYTRALVALRILPFGTLPAVLHLVSCYIEGMLYKGYPTVRTFLASSGRSQGRQGLADVCRKLRVSRLGVRFRVRGVGLTKGEVVEVDER